ncbi:MAG: hypothetical protein Q8N51_01425 [Gammaproteobacteria bacterium]|nr:hypothetical protein [Gammaproteobacteria bacterium]
MVHPNGLVPASHLQEGGNCPAGFQGDSVVEYLLETLIPVSFYAAIVLFLFISLTAVP